MVAVVILTAACSGSYSTAEPVISPLGANVPGIGVAAVVTAAQAFSQSLDSDQKKLALLDRTARHAEAWSDRPCGRGCRGGIAFADLETGQLTLAKALLQTALGSEDTGYARVQDLWAADDKLDALPGGGDAYGEGQYDLALLGTPSTSGTWMLHFGGHHLAVNLTYKNGRLSGASPYFAGVEPTLWTTRNGTTYAPLESMKEAVVALGSSLTAGQKRQAKLSQTFSDVLLGPGKDGRFPRKKQGVAVSGFSADQKDLVLDAIRQWVSIADDDTADATMRTYEDELDQTYLSWSGGLSMTAPSDYLRIDGPGVWIEFACRSGAVLTSRVQYQTVWRDHAQDYGGAFSS